MEIQVSELAELLGALCQPIAHRRESRSGTIRTDGLVFSARMGTTEGAVLVLSPPSYGSCLVPRR